MRSCTLLKCLYNMTLYRSYNVYVDNVKSDLLSKFSELGP